MWAWPFISAIISKSFAVVIVCRTASVWHVSVRSPCVMLVLVIADMMKLIILLVLLGVFVLHVRLFNSFVVHASLIGYGCMVLFIP